jgi:RNA polymerase sigma factor (sigma-70 family)
VRTLDDQVLASLLAGTAAGQRGAFRQLYELTAPKLLGVVMRMRHDRATAEDIIQDVFLRVWRNASQFRPDAGPAMSWIVSIARNRAIDVLRQRVPESLGSDASGGERIESIPGSQDAAGQWIDAESLRHCLGGIEPAHRECLVLAYCEGWSRDELGQRFGRPANTIKTWLHRGLASLRSCLDGT